LNAVTTELSGGDGDSVQIRSMAKRDGQHRLSTGVRYLDRTVWQFAAVCSDFNKIMPSLNSFVPRSLQIRKVHPNPIP